LNEKNDKEIYLFLGLLSIYEINIGKKHSEFVIFLQKLIIELNFLAF